MSQQRNLELNPNIRNSFIGGLMNCNPTPEREFWFNTYRKPTICPRCGKKEVRKAVLGYPNLEYFFNDNIYLIGCIPDFHIERNWGCRNCESAFFKDTLRNMDALGGLIPHQRPKE